MSKLKRTLAALAAACLTLALLAGCSPSAPENTGAASAPGGGDETTLRVVATIFPIYDWAREVLGQVPGVELVWLQDTGVDMHSYQPTAEDMLLVSSCDLFLYVGGTSDNWVDGALQEAVNKNMEVVSLLDVLGDAARLEELTEGMQAGHEDHDGHAHDGSAIADAMGRLDPAHAEDFAANAAAYTERLAALDGEYQAAVDASPVHTLLFGDRFPFRYLVEDYGLDYYAAFPGCSAETEASFELRPPGGRDHRPERRQRRKGPDAGLDAGRHRRGRCGRHHLSLHHGVQPGSIEASAGLRRHAWPLSPVKT